MTRGRYLGLSALVHDLLFDEFVITEVAVEAEMLKRRLEKARQIGCGMVTHMSCSMIQDSRLAASVSRLPMVSSRPATSFSRSDTRDSRSWSVSRRASFHQAGGGGPPIASTSLNTSLTMVEVGKTSTVTVWVTTATFWRGGYPVTAGAAIPAGDPAKKSASRRGTSTSANAAPPTPGAKA